MTPVEGHYLRVRRGIPSFGKVTVIVESPSPQPGVVIRLVGPCREGLGEVPETGYDDWKAGAKAGAEYALSVAGARAARVEVTRMIGSTLDTNPSSLAAAAAFAVWKALGRGPSSDALEILETVVADSRGRPFDWVPVLETL